MKDLQKLGGVAALIAAATVVMGVVIHLALLPPSGAGELEPGREAALLVDNQAITYVWHLIVYVVFGVFLVVLAGALHERLKAGSPAIVWTATAFGLIWAGLVIAAGLVANVGADLVVGLYGTDPAQAASLWLARELVVKGLVHGNEIVGGLWVLLVSWAALRAGGLPRALNYLGLVIGVAGLLTIVPALGEPGWAIVGLGLIPWLVWLGIVMVRSSAGQSRSS